MILVLPFEGFALSDETRARGLRIHCQFNLTIHSLQKDHPGIVACRDGIFLKLEYEAGAVAGVKLNSEQLSTKGQAVLSDKVLVEEGAIIGVRATKKRAKMDISNLQEAITLNNQNLEKIPSAISSFGSMKARISEYDIKGAITELENLKVKLIALGGSLNALLVENRELVSALAQQEYQLQTNDPASLANFEDVASERGINSIRNAADDDGFVVNDEVANGGFFANSESPEDFVSGDRLNGKLSVTEYSGNLEASSEELFSLGSIKVPDTEVSLGNAEMVGFKTKGGSGVGNRFVGVAGNLVVKDKGATQQLARVSLGVGIGKNFSIGGRLVSRALGDGVVATVMGGVAPENGNFFATAGFKILSPP